MTELSNGDRDCDLNPVAERLRLLETLDTVCSEALSKIQDGRIRDPKNEEIRCSQWRTISYVVDIQRRVLKDAADDLARFEEQAEEQEQSAAAWDEETDGFEKLVREMTH